MVRPNSDTIVLFSALLSSQTGTITREFDVSTHFGHMDTTEIIVDAFVLGICGILSEHGVPIEYFSVPIAVLSCKFY